MELLWNCFLFICYFTQSSLGDSDGLIKYYIDLITKNIIESENYVFPTYYEEFVIKDDQKQPEDFGAYDFIILGGGTAGALLANRLSEEETWSVLLIEAGGQENDFTTMPASLPFLSSSSFNWGSNTTDQKHTCKKFKADSQGSDVGMCSFKIGKGLGGSTLIHAMQFTRGIASDYKKWTDAGLNGWSFDELLPYMKKFENATSLEDIYPEYHGFEGEMKMENDKNISELSFAYMDAFQENGYKKTDYNGPNPFGYARAQISTYEGKRESTASVFLNETVRSRKNLQILTNSLVIKIDTTNSIVQSVEFIYNNTKYSVKINKEVILSAGVVGSAQLLMLSGIGPKEDLETLNIPVVKDLPVGQNFKDSFKVSINFDTNHTIKSNSIEFELSQYFQGFGRLTGISRKDNVVVYQQLKNNSSSEIIASNGFSLQVTNETVQIKTSNLTGCGIYLHHPKSVGNIKLKTNNPLDFPLIDPNFLAEKEDLDSIIEIVNNTISIFEAESLKKYNFTPIRYTTECGNFNYRSYEYLECIAKYFGSAAAHGIASCNMGVDPKNSVVNDKLLVHGMENLRVVDASVIPFTMTGHLFGTVLTVAEKAADIIKGSHK